MAPQPDRPPDAKAAACPCGHGDLPAETAGRPPLLDRAAAGDREAFVRIYDEQVDGVFRYLLAWTGDRAQAAELTGQVFRSAPRWLPAAAGGQGEAGAWLIAMARDAVQGPAVGQDPPAGPPRDTVEALGRLGDPQREVAVLRLLCGHSLDHTAQLSGYTRRAVLELQLAARLAISDLTGGAEAGATAAAAGPWGPPGPARSAEEFERRLGRRETDLAGGDPALAGALAAAALLRRAVPGYVVGPDDALVRRLRHDLWGSGAGRRTWRGWVSRGWRAVSLSRRPWLATAVATAGIMVVLALQAFGDPGPPAACGASPCPAPTTAAAAAGGDSSLGSGLTTLAEPPTTSTTGARAATPIRPADLDGRHSADHPPGDQRPPDHRRTEVHHDHRPADDRAADHGRPHDHDGGAGDNLASRQHPARWSVVTGEGPLQGDARRFAMWVDTETRARMRDRVQEAEQARLAAAAAAGRGGARPLAGYGRRLRQATGFGLVRTGLRLLDARRA